MAVDRQYLRTHPWITFQLDMRRFDPVTWRQLGEAESKVEHIAGVPLRPDVARRMHEVYLSKGIHGTTSIEGNTLSEDEVLSRVRGDLPLPPSREHLGREIDNILGICNEIIEDVAKGKPLPLTPERIREFNARILDGLPLHEGVQPGVPREHSVVVGIYRAAPAEDLTYLMDRYCLWLERELSPAHAGDMKFAVALLRAIMAHLYLAWIHPFSDGNGRTARIIEFQLLIQAGVPIPAAHILSDHYNKTRERYYQVLERTSRRDYPVQEFILYAVEGFVDELRDQLRQIRGQQMETTWQNLVHDIFRDQDTPARRRQKHLVLDLPSNRPVSIGDVRLLTPRLAEAYAGKQQKTVSRDINELERLELILKVGQNGRSILANLQLIEAFLPIRAPMTDDKKSLR